MPCKYWMLPDCVCREAATPQFEGTVVAGLWEADGTVCRAIAKGVKVANGKVTLVGTPAMQCYALSQYKAAQVSSDLPIRSCEWSNVANAGS